MKVVFTILTILIVLTLLGAAGGYFVYKKATTEPPLGTGTITIQDKTVQVEITVTEAQQNTGLSYRETLSQNAGMLFEYETLALPSFWMYEMSFPLDIIWIRDGEIIGIEKNVPVPEDPTNPQEMYRPEKAVTAVLEVNAGWTEANGIKVGDEVGITRDE